MKVTILKFCMLFLLMPFLSSCSKDDDGGTPAPVFHEENFMASYMTATGFDQTTIENIDSGDYEFGIEFTPLVKGNITSFKVKLPDVNNSLRITVWDKATTSVIKTEIANIAAANTEFTIDIIDLPLVKDGQYAITMNSNDWYDRRRTDGTSFTYPITAGNIQVEGYKWKNGTAQMYPTQVASNYYAGDLSFNFIQIE